MTDLAFTAVQRKILAILADGYCHRREELVTKCLVEQDCPPNNLQNHISTARKLLLTKGQNITSHRMNGTVYYQLCQFTVADESSPS